MQVSWPNPAGLGNLTCNGESSCYSVNFPIPEQNIELNIICDEWWKCMDADIYCPENAACIINCTTRQSCREVCKYMVPIPRLKKNND